MLKTKLIFGQGGCPTPATTAAHKPQANHTLQRPASRARQRALMADSDGHKVSDLQAEPPGRFRRPPPHRTAGHACHQARAETRGQGTPQSRGARPAGDPAGRPTVLSASAGGRAGPSIFCAGRRRKAAACGDEPQSLNGPWKAGPWKAGEAGSKAGEGHLLLR